MALGEVNITHLYDIWHLQAVSTNRGCPFNHPRAVKHSGFCPLLFSSPQILSVIWRMRHQSARKPSSHFKPGFLSHRQIHLIKKVHIYLKIDIYLESGKLNWNYITINLKCMVADVMILSTWRGNVNFMMTDEAERICPLEIHSSL